MKFIDIIKEKIVETRKMWYVYLLVFGLLEIINHGVVSLFVPKNVCFWIAAFLVFLVSLYIFTISKYVYTVIKTYFNEAQATIHEEIENMRKYVEDVDKKHEELSKELSMMINENVDKNAENIVVSIENDIASKKTDIIESLDRSEEIIHKKIDEKAESISQKMTEIANEEKKANALDAESIKNAIKNTNENIEKLFTDKDKDDVEMTERIVELIKNTNESSIESAKQLSESIGGSFDSVKSEIKGYAKKTEEFIDSKTTTMMSKFEENTDKTILEIKENKNLAIEINKTIENNFKETNERLEQNTDRIIDKLNNCKESIKNEVIENRNAISNGEQNISKKLDIITDKSQELNKGIIEGKQDILDTLEKEYEASVEAHRIITEGNKLINQAITNYADKQKAFNENVSTIVEKLNIDNKLGIESILNTLNEKSKEFENESKEIMRLLSQEIKQEITNGQALLVKHVNEASSEITEHLTENDKTSNRNLEAIDNKIDSMLKEKDELKTDIENRLKVIQNTVVDMQSGIVKTLNEILDTNEDEYEKQDRKIDLLGRQITEFSQKSQNSIKKIIELAQSSDEHLSEYYDKLQEYNSNQISSDEMLKKQFEKYSYGLDKNYNEFIEKFVLIQNEISSITKATTLLNAIYAILQNQKTSDTQSGKGDRIEEIKDTESGAIVKNHYKKDKLVFSEMISNGRKTYDVQFDNDGKITKSHNYNSKGDVITELEFYRNGQVKTRKELITKDGQKKTIVTKFDDHGNKLN